MGQLRGVGVGLLLVALDFRFNGLDVLPDIVGWALMLFGFATLAHLHTGFRIASVASAVGGMVELAALVGVEPDGVIGFVGLLATTAVVFATCTAVMDLVPTRAPAANTIRWLDVAFTVIVMLVILLARDGFGVGGVELLIVVLPALAVFIWFIVLVFQCAGEEPQAATPA